MQVMPLSNDSTLARRRSSSVSRRIAKATTAAAGADPLDKASDEEVAAGMRLRAEQGGDNKDRRTYNGDRLTPERSAMRPANSIAEAIPAR
jgi:hypothetical protein